MSETAAKGLRLTIREALLISVAATILGFAYTALTQKGIFSAPSPTPVLLTSDEGLSPEMIQIEEAQELFGSGTAVFIDTRDELEYRAGHIKGAINIPLVEFDTRLDSLRALPGDEVLITYCDGTECSSCIEFANRLYSAGISNVKIFFGGWEEWKASQLPMETSTP
jgi:rhodanese-related sulfurtransferase